MAARTLFLLCLLTALVAAQCRAALVATVGGCGLGTSGYTIHSAAENDAATQFLVDSGIRFAVLPATVSNGVLSWESGEAVTWQPSGFVIPSTGDYHVVLRNKGSWSTTSGTTLLFNFLCSTGSADTTTTTTTSTTTTTTAAPVLNTTTTSTTTTTTTAAPNTTTTTTTTTAAPVMNTTTTTTAFPVLNTTTTTTTAAPVLNTTTTPIPTLTPTTGTPSTTTTTTAAPAVVPTVSSVVQALKANVFDPAATISVMDFTSNVVYLPATAAVVHNVQTLTTNNSVIAVRFGPAGPVAALVAGGDAAPDAIGFQVPNSLYNVAATTSYALYLVTLDATATPTALSAQLQIVPVMTALQQMPSGVTIREVAAGTASTVATARFGGEGTAAPYTTDVSLAFTSALSFSMINNGAVGNSCTPAASSPLPYFVTRYDLRFVVPSSYISRLTSGRKSVCASYNGKTTVIAAIAIQALGATTTAPVFQVGDAIPVSLQGGSTTALAKGDFEAFLSTGAACSSAASAVPLMPLNTVSAAVDAANTPSALIVAPSEASVGHFVCMRRVSTSTAFAVTHMGGPVTIAHRPHPDPHEISTAPTPLLTVFNGSSGAVSLTELIRSPADATEVAAYAAARATLEQSYVAVRFVPLRAGATASVATRVAACQAMRTGEATQGVLNSVMQVSYPIYLQQPYGVLCAGNQYVRIDYVLVQSGNWLLSMADTAAFSANTFVLSSGPSQDAAPVTVRSIDVTSAAAANIAVRFSLDSTCAYGHTSPIGSYGTQQYVSYPTSLLGVYTVCAGIYSAAGTSMFVSTGATVSLASFAVARSNWLLDAGVGSSEWTPCGSVAMCGLHTEQKYIQVCNGAVSANAWPARLDGAFAQPGSLTVRMAGNQYEAPALALMNDVYVAIDVASSQCQEFGVWEMSSDGGASYGPGAVVLGNHPQLALDPAAEVSGVVVGFVPWDASCQEQHSGTDVMVARDAAGVSVVDMSGFLFARTDGYYAVCTYNGALWARVADTYVKVVSGVATAYRAEGISTGDALANENGIHLYQTQTATWSVIGTFKASVPMTFKLVWGDKTCTAAAAYTTPLTYVSPSTATVTVEASLIAVAPAGVTKLYPCYALSTSSSAAASPLPFELHRNRAVMVTRLTLSSLYYLPEFALSYAAPQDTRLLLTDPASPPITYVALQKVDSRATAPVCGSAASAAAVLPVEVDGLGQRWVTVASSVVQSLAGGATGEVMVKLCATASSSMDPEFVEVSAFLVLDTVGTSLTEAPMALRVTFLPLNASTDLLEAAVAQKALVQYTAAELKVAETAVLVAPLGSNAFELFLHPTVATGLAPQSTATPTEQLYKVLAANTNLPLYATSQVNTSAVFALATVEGVLLADQSSVTAYPVQRLKTSGTASTVSNLSGLSIALFCVVVAPTTVGFVAFSVQQTIPTLTRSKLGKKVEVYVETGDSPPPRNPRPPADKEMEAAAAAPAKEEKSDIPLSVVPRAEDTTDNPLYDSDDEPPSRQQPKAMSSSPPLRNDTFAMDRKKTAAHSPGSDDDLK